MGRKRRSRDRPRPKTTSHKISAPIAYRYCRRCRRQRIFLNGRCSACA